MGILPSGVITDDDAARAAVLAAADVAAAAEILYTRVGWECVGRLSGAMTHHARSRIKMDRGFCRRVAVRLRDAAVSK